jgi:hypothetical protein
VGAVVTACQRVGIRSQVQRLSRPHRGDRRSRRRRRRNGPQDAAVNGSAAAETGAETVEHGSNGVEPRTVPEPEPIIAPGPEAEAVSPPTTGE